MPRVNVPSPATTLLYLRPYVPYLLAPEYYWSFGPYIPDGEGTLNRLPSALSPNDSQALKVAGYCAILYDKLLASVATEYAIPLQGNDVSALDPSFENERYKVFIP